MISDFEWRHGVTLLSSRSSVALIVAAYLLMVALMPRMLRGPLVVPVQLMWLHNCVLCFGSAIMFVGASIESYRVRSDSGDPEQLNNISTSLKL